MTQYGIDNMQLSIIFFFCPSFLHNLQRLFELLFLLDIILLSFVLHRKYHIQVNLQIIRALERPQDNGSIINIAEL